MGETMSDRIHLKIRDVCVIFSLISAPSFSSAEIMSELWISSMLNETQMEPGAAGQLLPTQVIQQCIAWASLRASTGLWRRVFLQRARAHSVKSGAQRRSKLWLADRMAPSALLLVKSGNPTQVRILSMCFRRGSSKPRWSDGSAFCRPQLR
jgi:hypothetical protein